ncbi:hypothetical protein BGZ65_005651 [Modicella reniformis]|uniref:Uncharacterized protein n=1 Tax=Modicella reniformis TaxID=1440133 RepID=A0A9P6M399_9FUNG|nr:hypothetical protein BGZ65_005651 [Modicella reniformis]
MIKRNQDLQTFSLGAQSDLMPENLELMTRAISGCRHLTTLRLEFRRRPYRGWLNNILKNLPPTLQVISLHWKRSVGSNRLHDHDLRPYRIDTKDDWPHSYPYLEEIDFVFDLTAREEEGEEDVICRFLERCPVLTTLHYPKITKTNGIRKLNPILQSKGSHPRHLDSMSESQWITTAEAMKGRVKEFFTHAEFPEPLTTFTSTLTRYWADTLESIRFLCYSHLHQYDIQMILTTCSKLKKFECMWTASPMVNPIEWLPGIKVKKPESPSLKDWVCLDLEVLHLMFADERKPNLEPEEKLEQVKRTELKIEHAYQQIGRLTKLGQLTLGWRTKLLFVNDINLDMSLKSGLGYMENLKDLRILDITRIRRPNIGLEEVQWMGRNWPSLTEIRGMKSQVDIQIQQ